jgi:hypothetical protein
MGKALILLCSFLVFAGCGHSNKTRPKMTVGWSNYRFGKYSMQLPADYKVKYLNQTHSLGIFISARDSIYLTVGYLPPSFFDNYGKVLEKSSKGSVKRVFFFKSYMSGVGTAALFFYDTLNKTDLFGKMTYSSVLLVKKSSSIDRLDTLQKIFKSVSKF